MTCFGFQMKLTKKAMPLSARSIKIVEWSEEDQYFVGCCPGVIGP